VPEPIFATGMRSLRALSAWILLATMLALVLPREHWHRLGHDEHALEHASDGPTISSACAQCEVGMPVAIATGAITPPVQAVVHCPLPLEAVRGTSLGFTPQAADRGPPATC